MADEKVPKLSLKPGRLSGRWFFHTEEASVWRAPLHATDPMDCATDEVPDSDLRAIQETLNDYFAQKENPWAKVQGPTPETEKESIWTFSCNGEFSVLFSCSLCGAAVMSGGREKHEEFHALRERFTESADNILEALRKGRE